MEPGATQAKPIRSFLIFMLIGVVLLVAVILGIRWAKGRSDQYANLSKPQTVAQQPTQQQATPNAQTEAQKAVADQKAAEDKKKADEAAAAEKAKQEQVAKDKATADKAAADKAAADKAAADKAAADKAAADQAAAQQNQVAATPTTGPTPKAMPSTGIDDIITPIFGLSLLAFLTIRYIDSRRRLNVIS